MKKGLLLLLIGILAFCLCACGASPAEEPVEEAAEETTEEVAEETTEEVVEETAEDLVVIDGNTITLRDDGSADASTQNGMEKTPLITAHDINAEYQAGPIAVTIDKAQLSNIKISDQSTADLMGVPKDEPVGLFVLDVAVENTSEDDMGFYPNQSVIITSTKEQIDSDMLFSDSIGGDFFGQVVKSGQIYFFLSGPADDITHIQWRVSAPHDANFASVGDDLIVEFEFIK